MQRFIILPVLQTHEIITSKTEIISDTHYGINNLGFGGTDNARFAIWEPALIKCDSQIANGELSRSSEDPKAGEWESSGIIDVSKIFGKGVWLVNIQAHTINEGGQLLLMTVDKS